MTNKTYTRRDSVTAILRKMGVDKAEYNNHIITNADGTFSIREQDQTPPWEETPKTEAAPAAESKKSTKTEAPKAEKEPRRTVSSAAREHILAGHDNKKVFELLKNEFNLDDNKKSYPGWYRSELKRKGQLTA